MKKHVVIFLIKGNEVLLAMKKRGLGEGNWNGPGGKVENGESFTDAVIRECYEEITVTPVNPKPVADLKFEEYHGDIKHSLDVRAFVCYKWRGDPEETEEMSPKWFSMDRLPFGKMWSDDPYWLPKILRGELIKGHFKLDKAGKVISSSVNKASSIAV